ncbi:MAG: CoA transferase [Gammaproteobacteria bacterium]|nr:CoA transferase [Gammaproteobacteria bacterium]
MLPLQGVRVLAVEQYGAGPFGTMFLADQGAEVIKVENPRDGGDMARGVGPFFLEEGDSLFFQSFNRNKKSLTLDLQSESGQAVFRRLVTQVDAVTSNLRGDVPDKLGLTYRTLGACNPRIVCAHLSAYGRSGPRAAWPGYDYLMQAEAGWFSLTGEPDGPPSRFGLSVVDLMTGLGLAYATLAALTQARATGQGSDIDVSLFDMALHCTNYLASWYLNAGHMQTRLPRGAHPSLTPCAQYKTADGWIYIMCNKEKFWPILCEQIGRPELAADPRFLAFKDRLANRDLVTELLDEALSARTTDEWLARFAGIVPAAPIYDLRQALENPFVTENDRLQTLPHPARGSFRLVQAPIRAQSPTPAQPAPALGADTQALLTDAGFSTSEIEALRADGVI